MDQSLFAPSLPHDLTLGESVRQPEELSIPPAQAIDGGSAISSSKSDSMGIGLPTELESQEVASPLAPSGTLGNRVPGVPDDIQVSGSTASSAFAARPDREGGLLPPALDNMPRAVGWVTSGDGFSIAADIRLADGAVVFIPASALATAGCGGQPNFHQWCARYLLPPKEATRKRLVAELAQIRTLRIDKRLWTPEEDWPAASQLRKLYRCAMGVADVTAKKPTRKWKEPQDDESIFC